MAYNSGYWEELEGSLRKQLAEARAENAALVAEFQRLADEPPTLEEIAADLDKIEMLETELAEARAEIERLALEIENQQYTITCASEENQQLKESLAEARAEIERLKGIVISQITPEPVALSSYSTTAEPAKDERDRLIEQMRELLLDMLKKPQLEVWRLEAKIRAALSEAERMGK